MQLRCCREPRQPPGHPRRSTSRSRPSCDCRGLGTRWGRGRHAGLARGLSCVPQPPETGAEPGSHGRAAGLRQPGGRAPEPCSATLARGAARTGPQLLQRSRECGGFTRTCDFRATNCYSCLPLAIVFNLYSKSASSHWGAQPAAQNPGLPLRLGEWKPSPLEDLPPKFWPKSPP